MYAVRVQAENVSRKLVRDIRGSSHMWQKRPRGRKHKGRTLVHVEIDEVGLSTRRDVARKRSDGVRFW